MHFIEEYTYHVYNRSNELLFYDKENYSFFIEKIKKYIVPLSDILAWCLLPNHFHLLLVVKPEGTHYVSEKHRSNTQVLSKNIGTLLSSYTLAINKRNKRKGALFAHKTKAKVLNLMGNTYPEICFNYIHLNPFQSGYVNQVEDWEYSSYKAYLHKKDDGIVNMTLAEEMIHFDISDFREWSNAMVDENQVKQIH